MIMVEVINEYDIASKFHCYVADNASNNDNATTNALAEMLNIELGLEHCIRCLGHMQQLAVKAVIYGKGLSKWEATLAAAAPLV
jgi:hypothetical protein